jgi:hypothetical protein
LEKRQLKKAKCGCEIPATLKFKKSNNCNKCNDTFCSKHLYSYVDESNRAITKNSKNYCETCYKEKYKRGQTPRLLNNNKMSETLNTNENGNDANRLLAEVLISKLQERLKLFPDEDDAGLYDRGLYDGYLNSLKIVTEECAKHFR